MAVTDVIPPQTTALPPPAPREGGVRAELVVLAVLLALALVLMLLLARKIQILARRAQVAESRNRAQYGSLELSFSRRSQRTPSIPSL